jgi:DNA-binding winged helix-turn-helix (wHTH) protein/cytochrome c-type biogenesis protein CcmH/NrfG
MRFNGFTLDLSRCIVLRGSVEVPLRPQAFDLLRYLAEHPSRLISKEELIKAVWRRVAVSDDSLVRCVRDIREALGDRDQQIIETVRGRGYLFAADVVVVEGSATLASTAEREPEPSWGEQSIVKALRRHALSTGWRGLILLGAAVIVTSISAWSLRTPPVASNAAHYAILGRTVLQNERSAKTNREALGLFSKALALDPDWVPALLGYASVMVIEVGGEWVPPAERPARLDQAEAAVERAIRLEPTNAVAHLIRGVVLRMRGDSERAVAAFERSLEFNRDAPWTHAEFGRTKIELGRADEALNDIETALRLNPSETAIHVWYCWAGMAALHAGKNDEAVQWLLKAREARPAYPLPVPLLAVAYVETGREAEGRALMIEHVARSPGFTMQSVRRSYPSRNPTVARQRERIANVLRGLGVPDGGLETGSVHP